MSPLRLNGSTSGFSQLDAPAIAGDQTFTLPSTGGTLATTNAGSVTTAMLASTVPVAKAWVNFNGTGTVAIRASYNVSSITDNGTGHYTINFTTAFADSNYSVAGAASYSSATWGNAFFLDGGAWNVSSFEIRTAEGFIGASLNDSLYCCVSVFR